MASKKIPTAYISYEDCLFHQKMKVVDYRCTQEERYERVTIQVKDVFTECRLVNGSIYIGKKPYILKEFLLYLIDKLPPMDQKEMVSEVQFLRENAVYASEICWRFLAGGIREVLKDLVKSTWDFHVENFSYTNVIEGGMEIDLVQKKDRQVFKCLLSKESVLIKVIREDVIEGRTYMEAKDVFQTYLLQSIRTAYKEKKQYRIGEVGNRKLNSIIYALVKEKIEASDEYRFVHLFH